MAEFQADRFEFDGFQFDVERRLLLGRDGVPVSVTPKALDTLLHLLEHRGKVVSKEALIKAVWPDTAVEENNLNQNISALRRVLGGDRKENRFIVTVQSRGYSFVAPVKSVGGSVPALTTQRLKSLAVLPFKPLVTETSDASLELGMADTLIARLSTIRELVVRPISSVRMLARGDEDPLAVGRQLNVDHVLEGTLQRYGAKVRVSARLLDAIDGKALWAGTFDEPFTDIFLLQDAISEKVVKALELHLNSGEIDRLTKHGTTNPEAYRLYLKGRYYWWNTDPQEFNKSQDYFHRAVEADPKYALGYCGLNSFYGFSAAWGLIPPEFGWPKAEWAMRRALELDDTLAEAHLGNAAYKMAHRDFRGAETEAKRGIALNPNFDEIQYFYSFLLMVMGRFEDAIEAARRALDSNPFSARINLNLGSVFFYAGRSAEAISQYTQAIELNPKDAGTHEAMGDALEQAGDLQGALASWLRAARLAGDAEIAAILESHSAADFDNAVRAVASAKIQRLHAQQSSGGYVPSAHFARQYLRLGETEKAREYLLRAAEEPNVFSLLVARDPQFKLLAPKSSGATSSEL